MKRTKRIISLLLVIVMIFTMLPAYALATEQTQSSTQTNTPSLQGSNSFGNLIVEDIHKKQESVSDDSGADCDFSVSELVIEGNTATVTYSAEETATLVVAIYTEDGLKLVTSGNTMVDPVETVATVSIAGTMPDYFMASAYLLDSYNLSPLCKAYETPMYTRDMQELLASTAEDYDAEKVLQLDDDQNTNFAVFSAETQVIEYVEGRNTVTSANEDTSTYVISNADSQFTGLKVGNLIAYAYGDNNILIVKVASISVSGTTVTLTGADLAVEEVFEVIKLEGGSRAADVADEEVVPTKGVSYAGKTDGTSAYDKKAWEGEQEYSSSFGFDLVGLKVSVGSASVSVDGSVDVSFDVSLSYYLTLTKRKYIDFRFDYLLKGDVSVTASVTFDIPLAKPLVVPILKVATITIAPVLQISFSATADIVVEVRQTIGFTFDTTKSEKFTRVTPKPVTNTDIEVTGRFFIGLSLTASLEVLKGKVLSLELSTPVGFEALVSRCDEYAPNSGIRHQCEDCFVIDINFLISIDLELRVLKLFWEEWTIWDLPIGLTKLYYSKDLDTLGFGTCPNVKYRLYVDVSDRTGAPLGAVTIKDGNGTTLGVTNAYGVFLNYYAPGMYTIKAVADWGTASSRVYLDQPAKVKLTLPVKPAGSQGGSGGTDTEEEQSPEKDYSWMIDKLDDFKISDIQDYGTLIKKGNCGDKGDNIIWGLYSGGLLKVTGTGKMADYSVVSQNPFYSLVNTSHYVISRIEISEGITHIGKYAFAGLKEVNQVTIPSTVQSIGVGSFFMDTSLKSVTLPQGLTTISDSLFNQCTSLEKVEIPDSVTSIGSLAFYTCALTSVELPASLTTIGTNAFNQSGLTELIIPASVTSIGSNAFIDCVGLKNAVIGKGVTSIGNYAFSGCTSLSNVQFEYGVTTIGEYAFRNCTALTKIQLPDSVTTIEMAAFNGCTNLKDVTLSNNLISIKGSAFFGCSALTSISIPASVKEILNNPFKNTSLNDVYITDLVKWFQIDYGGSGFLFQSAENSRLFLNGQLVTELVIPDEVTSINAYCVAFCGSITGIRFHSGVTSIGDLAFYNAYNLKAVTVPGNVLSIGRKAFENCDNLTTVVLQDGITSIGASAFDSCNKLESVTLPNTLTSINEKVFYLCRKLKSITIPASVTTIGPSAIAHCYALESVTMNAGVTSIGANAFEYSSKITSITIPKTVVSIEDYAFKSCSGLKEIWFEGKIPTIASGSFTNVTATAYYLSSGWNSNGGSDYGGKLYWTSYTSKKLGTASNLVETGTMNILVTSSIVRGNAIIGGEYETQDAGDYILKTATFRNLTPGEWYTLLSLVDVNADDVLSAENLLYIQQAQAGEDGVLIFQYVQRVDAGLSYVFLCGPSVQHIKDAVAYFPEMEANGQPQMIKPVLVYNDVTLVEGVDYLISGDVAYTLAGQHSCTIAGINEFTGSIEYVFAVGGQAQENPSFKGATLTLESNLTVSFNADKTWMDQVGYTDPYAVFRMNDIEYVVTDYTVEGERYVFTFKDINPNKMNDTFIATLHATCDGRVCTSKEYPYSISQYCYNMLGKTTDTNTRTLLVDLLNYGAATQIYSNYKTDALANAALTQEQRQWATQTKPSMKSVMDTAYDVVNNPDTVWKSATLALNESVAVRLKFTTDQIEGLSLRVRTDFDEWIVNADRFEVQDGVYYVVIDELNAVRMRDTLYFTFLRNGTPVSNTLQYSIETYACKKQAVTENSLGDLVVAMMKYGDSARRYDGYEDTTATVTSGECGLGGNNVRWSLTDGVLHISGSGAMADFKSCETPWYAHVDSIRAVSITYGITRIGNYAFSDFTQLSYVELPESIVSIGQYAFSGCTNLKKIDFVGHAPNVIGANAFYGVTAVAYYPQGYSSWTSDKLQNFGGTITWSAYSVIWL